jgi:hypothetical protein
MNMNAESQHLEDLKKRIAELEKALEAYHTVAKEFKRRDDDAMAAIQRLERTIEDKNQINVIWSEEHGAWWAPGRSGYTRSLSNAGRYSKEEAQEIVTGANKYLPAGRFNEVAVPDPL